MRENSSETASSHIAPDVVIGHVHLEVADLERSLEFYRDVLGFQLTQRMGAQRHSCRQAGITITSG